MRKTAIIVLPVILLSAGLLYAATGNLIVDGNLGIGTSTPACSLEVAGPTGYARFDAQRTYFNGFDGAGSSWLGIQGHSEPGNLFMRFLSNDGISANAVELTPGGGDTFYVSSSGNVAIGSPSTGTGGKSALLFAIGSKPTAINGLAGLRAGVNGSTTALYVFDEAGNETLVTPHAGDAPDWMYDLQDGLPLIVKEVQYFLGYVRYTNQTRQSRLVSMTDAEKSSLADRQRTCVYTESFAQYNARLGLNGDNALVKLDWLSEQQAIQANRQAQIVAAQNAEANLEAAIASANDPDTRAALIQQRWQVQVPAEYAIQDPPARLKAALNSGIW